jgi:5-methyltetrahydrofolate--homocysteine methyltransferase
MSDFLAALRERVLIFDGAMGTQIQAANLSLDEYWGKEGNSEVLNLSRPDVISNIHRAYFEAGADAVETNTFGANNVVQGEYEMADQVYELNVTGARLAKEVAASFADRPRWVIGSVGPGTKLPSLGHTTFDELEASYALQVKGLIDGGADAIIIETCQDMLQVKGAVAGAVEAFVQTGTKLPLIVQITIETTGTMLLGTEIGAALTALEPFEAIDVVGLNCATGPVEMTEHVRFLCQSSKKFVSVLPNAGLPELRDGKPFYPLTPEEFVRHQTVFVKEFGTNIAGGCCGTTPEHISQLAAALGGTTPMDRAKAQLDPGCSSLYIAQPFHQDTSFFVIGERCNVQGSRKFKEIVGNEDWDSTVRVAKEQIREGAHSLDVSVDFTGRDGVPDMAEVISRFRTQVTLPIFLDSTEPQVIEAGLKLLGGRAVINSINLEEGTGDDSRLMRNLRLAKKYGAACVALAIDENGQATTKDWKLEVCKRLAQIARDEAGLRHEDLIFDALVFPITTGMEEQRRAALETIDTVRAIKEEIPGAFTSLGVSNVSFGLSPAARQVLNSIFLHEAVEAGLDAAIVSPAQILPMSRIDERQREVGLDLVYDRRRDGYDPLQEFIALFEGVEHQRSTKEDLSHLPLDERLKRRIIDGEREGLEQDLDQALETTPALDIINTHLLDGMKVVGDLFGSGEMQLPFVLQSAETMKAAVSYLEPYMEKADGDGSKGRIVLATVKGDVHDIGKNLVDIILTNNGYSVVNIGIKQPITSIIEAAERERADVIGLSGLLVKSTIVMREDLEELNRRELHSYPVLLGGAALTRSYVEKDLREIYKGRVFYGRDAFEGLHTMDQLMAEKRGGTVVEAAPKEKRVRERPAVAVAEPGDGPVRSDVATDVPVPAAPFFGSRVVKGLNTLDIARLLNKTTLYRGQWQFRPKKGQPREEYDAFIEAEVEPVFRSTLDAAISEGLLNPAVVYGYFPAQSEGDDLIVYDAEHPDRERVRFSFPRQPKGRRLCISDFFRSVASGEMDVVAFHVVTMGSRVSERAQELFESNQYREYLYLHGLGVEMAEALAEFWHKRVREELGVAGDDAGDVSGLFGQGYRGSRYSFGYPACPNLEDQKQIFDLLDPDRIGVALSEEFQLVPEQSTSAIIVHHPEAKYFSVGRAAITPS